MCFPPNNGKKHAEKSGEPQENMGKPHISNANFRCCQGYWKKREDRKTTRITEVFGGGQREKNQGLIHSPEDREPVKKKKNLFLNLSYTRTFPNGIVYCGYSVLVLLYFTCVDSE